MARFDYVTPFLNAYRGDTITDTTHHVTELEDRLARDVLLLANQLSESYEWWEKSPEVTRAITVLGFSISQARTGSQ